MNSRGKIELRKEFILVDVVLNDLLVFPGFAYAYLNGEEVRTVYFGDHIGEIVPINYLIKIDFGDPVSGFAFAPNVKRQIEFLCAIKTIASTTIRRYTVYTNPKAFNT